MGRRGGEDAVSAFLRKGVWKLSRSYRPATPLGESVAEFDNLVARIAASEPVSPDELLPYLCLEGRAQRAEVNAMLAEAYSRTPTEAGLRQAQVFIRRAWLLSGFSADLLPLYTKISSALNDTPDIREALKRLGMKAAARGDISEAIRYFNDWQWAYQAFNNLDKYEYDFDILNCVDELAAPHRTPAARQAAPSSSEKIRLAYLLKGVTEPNSILIKTSIEFARYHDKSRFDVTFFTAEPDHTIALSPQGLEYLKMFEDLGYQVITAPQLDSPADSLLALAARIRESRPHILIATAALADFSQYFITTLRPAPIVMGFVQGPAAQFAPPALDWCVAWTKHALMDCPVNCSWVEMKLDYPRQDSGEAYSDPTRAIRECEEVYTRVLKRFSPAGVSA